MLHSVSVASDLVLHCSPLSLKKDFTYIHNLLTFSLLAAILSSADNLCKQLGH